MMKKLFVLLLAALMLLSLAACGEDTEKGEEVVIVEETSPASLGGWTLTPGAELSEEALAAFGKAMDGLVGVSYEPLALVGTQLVSGTNYCILCQAQVVVPNAVPYYALVYVYADLQGEAQILSIVNLDLGDIAETGQIKAAENPPQELFGGWMVDRESSVELDGALLHLASQVVKGVNHCVLCEGGRLVFVYENLKGETQVTSEVALDPGALIG